MKRNTVSFAAAALLAGLSLNACSQSSDEAEAQNNQNAAAPAAPAVKNLPPAIRTSRTYRCPDNSLVYVDFFVDDTASIRLEEIGTPTRLTKANGAGAFTAEGYSVAADAASTRITVPG